MKEKTTPAWTRTALAKAAGVGAETLRFYEQKGLLGEPARNASGYRIYQTSDLDRLKFIRRSQELGFSLQDIAQLLELTGNIRTPRKKVREFASARLELIRGKIRDLRAMERALGKLVTDCDGRGAMKGCPIVEFVAGGSSNEKGCRHE
ncbi:MAG: MerR family transcriptional regulator [Verrucomicrobiota bacterium]